MGASRHGKNPLNHANVDFGEISGLLGCFGRVNNSLVQATMSTTLSKVEFPYTKKSLNVFLITVELVNFY